MLCPSCGKNEAEGPHPCPYQEDINGVHDDVCECCPECEQNCMDDI